MKTIILFSALVVIALAVIVPIAQGLECYICVSGDGAKNLPGFHKNCTVDKEGKLPDSLLKTCVRGFNIVDPETRQPYSASYVELKEISALACGKTFAKVGVKEATEKYCTYALTNNVDRCEGGVLLDNGLRGTSCICHDDKCNSAVSLNLKSVTLIAAVSAAFLAKVGV